MNLLTLDPGTMAGMSDDHLIASVEPLLMTPMEKELFKRFAYHSLNDDRIELLDEYGIDDPDHLKQMLNQPECPEKDVLDEAIDDALYLAGMFVEGSEGKEVAERLHKTLTELQGELI